jgi:pimeloyl-ACP methyl ester carboxylesterase
MSQADLTRRLIRVGEVELLTVSAGMPQRPCLLVVHGGPDWDHSYLLQPLLALSSSHRVIWFDLRGCGGSSRGLGPTAYRPDFVIEDIAGVLDAFGVDRADVLGFSYGGQLAQRLVDQHAARVARLVLASTTSYGTTTETSMAHNDVQRVSPALVEGVLADEGLTPIAKTRALAERTAPLDIWDLRRLEEYRSLLNGINFSGDWMEAWQSGELHAALPVDAPGALAQANVQTLILHGRQDLRFPVGHAERLHSELPTSTLRVIENAGHMAHWEQPDAWLSAVASFLS